MMLEVSITPTTSEDLDELAEHMRDIDRKECRLTMPMPVRKALSLSHEVSYETLTGRVDGKLVAVFGIARMSTISSVGVPWMLGTPLVERYAMTVIRYNREMISKWEKQHSILKNYVHVDNETSIRWLRWLGFTILKPVRFGAKNEFFHPFELRSKTYVQSSSSSSRSWFTSNDTN